MEKMQTYFGGVPTNIDVECLISAFGVPAEGKNIKYEEIEECLSLKRSAYRYKTVVTAWRKKLERENNIILVAIMNEGFIAANPSMRVEMSGRKYKGGLKRIGRAVEIIMKTDRVRLTDQEKRVADHLQRTGSSLRMSAAIEARQLIFKV